MTQRFIVHIWLRCPSVARSLRKKLATFSICQNRYETMKASKEHSHREENVQEGKWTSDASNIFQSEAGRILAPSETTLCHFYCFSNCDQGKPVADTYTLCPESHARSEDMQILSNELNRDVIDPFAVWCFAIEVYIGTYTYSELPRSWFSKSFYFVELRSTEYVYMHSVLKLRMKIDTLSASCLNEWMCPTCVLFCIKRKALNVLNYSAMHDATLQRIGDSDSSGTWKGP